MPKTFFNKVEDKGNILPNTNIITSYGARDENAKILQKMLNRNGYKLDVNGTFDDLTLSAFNDYQKKNGLAVSNYVGQDVWNMLSGGPQKTYTTTPATNPNTKGANSNNASSFTYKDFDYGDFTYGDYKESDTVKNAYAALQAQLAQKPGEYQSQWQTQLDDTIKKILNREKFSYDLNGDALYQQYKDKFIQQGKMAMGDAIGQASAMTGGYGNSYAQSVGQQAYQAQLQNLNDIVPELYQMALDKYNREGQELYNQYAMLGDAEDKDYGRYRDTVADWLTERDYLTGRYDTERDYDYSKYVDDRNFEYGKYSDDRNLAYDEYANDKSYAYNEYRNAIEDALAREQFEYQKERDRISDEQWQKEYDAVYGNKKTTTTTSNNSTVKESSNPSKISPSLGSDVDSYVGANNDSSQQTKTPAITEEIRNKAASFTNNDSLNDYLTRQYNAGKLTEEQMGELYLEYEIPSLSGRDWKKVDDGGVNWFWGIDNNATVKDQYGNEYRLDKLVDALAAEGMDKSAAKEYVKKLQKQLGL